MGLNECDDSATTSENNKDRGKDQNMIHVKQGNIMGAHQVERGGGNQ